MRTFIIFLCFILLHYFGILEEVMESLPRIVAILWGAVIGIAIVQDVREAFGNRK